MLFFLASCKEENEEADFPLGETNWQLYFKHNNTFSFFAESVLSFSDNNTVLNYRNADTVSGIWNTKGKTLTINFEDGDVYLGNIILDDSISGILSASNNNGIWYAVR